MQFVVRPLSADDHGWVVRFIEERWGSRVVSRGRLLDPAALPGFAASRNAEVVGLATYQVEGTECELVTIDSKAEGEGIGTALVEAVVEVARAAGCRRLSLITTNDNLRALRFYQRRGFRLAALYPDALKESRRLKPSISEVGFHGIPLRDELELERLL